MSEMMVTTDERRPFTCPTCEAETEQIKLAGFYGSSRWKTARHTSPCGFPCIRGGVDGRAYRDRKVHGATGMDCPGCTKS